MYPVLLWRGIISATVRIHLKIRKMTCYDTKGESTRWGNIVARQDGYMIPPAHMG